MIGAAAARARGIHPRDVALNAAGVKGLSFRTAQIIQRIVARHGRAAALEWIHTLTKYERQISETALRNAIVSKNLSKIAAVLDTPKLQMTMSTAMRVPLTATVRAAGSAGATVLKAHGFAASFNAVHPDVVLYARTQAAKLVVGIPKETREVIRTVVAWGQERGVTVIQQARAIREVVGLPPNWALAPERLAEELRAGNLAAVGRRLSATEVAQIRSRISAGTVDDAFVQKMVDSYTQRLINLRATTIAQTETQRAANWGLLESWKQAIDEGTLPATSMRYWLVNPRRVCPICAEIPGMNPDGVGMDEPFETPEGPIDLPPVHPNCGCTMGLVV